MNVEKTQQGQQLTLKLSGRLDAMTSPVLENDCLSSLNNVTLLVLDCTNLSYVSSAGLRVLLTLHKYMEKQGRMIVCHVQEDVMDVFDITGFNDVLNLE